MIVLRKGVALERLPMKGVIRGYPQSGFDIVNKLGYVMTRKPWVDPTLDAICFLDDFDREESESAL